MHHAPAGPPLSARLAAALARSRSRLLAVVAVVRPGLRFLRRTRLVPVLLAGLVIAVLALAAPVPAVGRTPASTAALTAPSDGGRELVPATGDGWTEDGAPAAPAPAPDSGAAAGHGPGAAPVGGTAAEAPAAEDTAPSSAADPPVRAATAPETSTGTPTETPVAGTSSATAPSSPAGPGSTDPTAGRDPSPYPSASSSSVAPSPSPPAPTPPVAVEAPAVDEVLAALNAARAAGGCDPLTEDAGLAGAAAAHSAAMRDRATLLPPPGAGAVAGELDDPAAVAAGWLADPAVPSTDCALTAAGVGVADGWWTLLLV